jgi:hypothetical protein
MHGEGVDWVEIAFADAASVLSVKWPDTVSVIRQDEKSDSPGKGPCLEATAASAEKFLGKSKPEIIHSTITNHGWSISGLCFLMVQMCWLAVCPCLVGTVPNQGDLGRI